MRTVSDVAYEMALDVSGARNEDDQTMRIMRQIEKRDAEWKELLGRPFCTEHRRHVEGGSCSDCKGDRNLIVPVKP